MLSFDAQLINLDPSINMATNNLAQSEADYLSSAEAAQLLGIKPQTLYSYVSRGLVRSTVQGGDNKRLYARTDLESLRARSDARSGHGPAAAGAMHWGQPIIPTAITELTSEGPRYRGWLALDLARSNVAFENVAELLWTGRLLDEPIHWKHEPLAPEVEQFTQILDTLSIRKPVLEAMNMLAMAIDMARGTGASRVGSTTAVIAARQLIQALTGCFGYLRGKPAYVSFRPEEGIASNVLRACRLAPTKERLLAMNAMMVLLADHELSPSTFVARVAASTGSDLHACVVAAIATGSGSEVARHYDRVEAFFSGKPERSELMRRVKELHGTGKVPPGFNPAIYPEGDPRVGFLLDLAKGLSQTAFPLAPLIGFLQEADAKFRLKPRVEIGVYALSLAIGMPKGAAPALYTLARIAGWVAHSLEQRLTGSLLRPRARFVPASV